MFPNWFCVYNDWLVLTGSVYIMPALNRLPPSQVIFTQKKCWVVSTQIWVKYGQTQMLG